MTTLATTRQVSPPLHSHRRCFASLAPLIALLCICAVAAATPPLLLQVHTSHAARNHQTEFLAAPKQTARAPSVQSRDVATSQPSPTPLNSSKLWLRTQSQSRFAQPLRVVEQQHFLRYNRQLRDLLALYFGALLILALIHFRQFLASKNQTHLFLSLCIAFWGLGQLSAHPEIIKDYLNHHRAYAILPFATTLKLAAVLFAILLGRSMVQSFRQHSSHRTLLIGLSALSLTGLLVWMALSQLGLIPLSALAETVPHLLLVAALVAVSRGIALRQPHELHAGARCLALRDTAQTPLESTDQEQDVAQAQKMEALGRLVGGISHDFKNLLTPLYGYAELIQQHAKTESERIVVYADKLMGSIKHIRDYSTNLLRFSRKQDLECTVLNLEDTINHVIDHLRQLNDHDNTITTRFDAPQPILSGDRALIEDALLNLGRNACEALSPKGGNIVFETARVHLEQQSLIRQQLGIPAGGYLTVTVSDSGCGMSPQVVQHLFEPFFTTKPRGQGSGLGLATVWGCMKSHQGAIAVHSTPEQGSSFTLYFPLQPHPANVTTVQP